MLLPILLIHLVIGEIYAQSVLYSSLPWTRSFSVFCFSLTILTLGISAGLYKLSFNGKTLLYTVFTNIVIWIGASLFIYYGININSQIIYLMFSLIKGFAIGVLYASTISAITDNHSKAIYSGSVVMSFGLGSLIASQLYTQLPYIFVIVINTLILALAMYHLNIESTITHTPAVIPVALGSIFFLNISIGITLLSNLVQFTKQFGTIDGVILVGISGLCNGIGRLIFPAIADSCNDKVIALRIALFLQFFALLLPIPFEAKVVICISVYGGVFALMPSICKEQFSTGSYCTILPLWGLAGLIAPNILSVSFLPFVAVLPLFISIFGVDSNTDNI